MRSFAKKRLRKRDCGLFMLDSRIVFMLQSEEIAKLHVSQSCGNISTFSEQSYMQAVELNDAWCQVTNGGNILRSSRYFQIPVF